MKGLLGFCRVLGVCALILACGHRAGDLDKLFAKGQVDEVLRVSGECLQENPLDENCLLFRAKALERARRSGEAITAWKDLLNVSSSNREAVDRLLHYADRIPNPSLDLWVLNHATVQDLGISDDSRRLWETAISMRDSLAREAAGCSERGMFSDAIGLLRQARRHDAADLDVRRSLCDALLRVSRHGLTLATRTTPLKECRTLLEDPYLEPDHRLALEDERGRVRAQLDEEMRTYERAASYTPWARAPFIAVVDSSSYFPWVRFRCDESQYADLRIEFPPGDGQFVLTEEAVPVRRGSLGDSPVVAMIRGSAGMVVLEKGPSYFLVSSGEEIGFRGWIRRDVLREKNRVTYELQPRGAVEFRTAVTKAHINVDVNGMNFWRGEVELEPYIRYEWSF